VGQGTLEIQARLDKEAADFDNWFEPGGSDDEGEVGLETAGSASGGGATASPQIGVVLLAQGPASADTRSLWVRQRHWRRGLFFLGSGVGAAGWRRTHGLWWFITALLA